MSADHPTAVYRKLAGNTAALVAASVIGAVALFGSRVVVARTLSKADYDVYVLAVAVLVFFVSISELGLTEGTTRRVAMLLGAGRRGETPAVGVRAMLISLVVGAALGAAAFFLRREIAWVAGMAEVADQAPMIALAVAPFAVLRIVPGFFAGWQRMDYVLTATLFREPVRLVVLVVMAALGMTLGLAVTSWAVAGAVTLVLTVILWLVFLRRAGLGLRGAGRLEGRGLVSESKYLYFPFLAQYLLPVLMPMMVGRFSPTGGVGDLDVSLSLANLTMMVFLPVSIALLPTVSGYHAQGRPIEPLVRTFTRVIALAALAGLLFFVLAGEQSLVLIFGSGYGQALPILLLGVAGIYFDAFKFVLNPALKGSMKDYASTWIDVARMIVTFGAGIPLTMVWGPVGAMAGFLAGCFLSTLLMLWALRHLLGINCWGQIVMPTLWAAILLAGMWLGHPVVAVVLIAVAMIVRPPLTIGELVLIHRTVRAVRRRGRSREDDADAGAAP